MKINTLEDGQSAKIIGFSADEQLFSRFFSFGISSGKVIKKLSDTLCHDTVAIELGRSCVILRESEANSIIIEPL
ncbi:FeoA family protein [Campylobacter magnus]|uniref:FeoA family protein n=1 Tax=Campylobacter magnus TaxID=3026462 RepID=UPI0023605F54|nr:FeoA family protein [Campylobacter magnus]MDD0856219.1 FeoA family protein [Campylobacter magnus]